MADWVHDAQQLMTSVSPSAKNPLALAPIDSASDMHRLHQPAGAPDTPKLHQPAAPPKLPADIWPPLVCCTILLTGMTMTWPVVDVFLVDLLGKADAARWKGWHNGITAATGAALTPLVGAFSDSFGRKPALIGCFLLFAGCATCTLIGVTTRSIAWMTAGRVHSIGLLLTLVKAVVSDLTDGPAQVRGLGVVGGCFAVAMVCGPAIGAAVGTRGYAIVFAVSAATAFLALVVSFGIKSGHSRKQRQRRHDEPAGTSFKQLVDAVQRLAADRLLIGTIVAYSLVKLVSLNSMITLGVYVQHRYSWGSRELGILMVCFGVSSGLVNVFGSKYIAPRTQLHLPIVFGGALWQVASSVMYGLSVEWWMLVLTLGVGQPFGLIVPVLDKKVATMAGEEAGFALGCVNSIQSALEIVSVPLMGQLLGHAIHRHEDEPRAPGVGLPFFVNAPLGLVAFGLLCVLHFRFGRYRPEWTGVRGAAYAGMVTPTGTPRASVSVVEEGRCDDTEV